jgi:hypothetical protein
MSSVLSKNLESTKNYTLYISSNDKISGSNNNGVYDVNYSDFLPQDFDKYKVGFAFQSGGGQYKDVTNTTTFNITQITGNSISVITTGTGVLGIGSLITCNNTVPSLFNGTISGNQLTQVGAVTSGNVCIPSTLTGTGTSTSSFTGAQTTTFTASGSGTTLTVTAVTLGGAPAIGATISGTGISGACIIQSQISGTPGGIGTYLMSTSQTFASTTVSSITSGSSTFFITATSSAPIIGQTITGTGITGSPTILSQLFGTSNGVGTYTLSSVQTFSSTTLTGTLAYSLSGVSITALYSGTLSTGGAIYTLSKDFSNTVNNQVAVTGSFSVDLTTIPTYITSGTAIKTTDTVGKTGTFTISRSICITPSGISITGASGTPQIYSGVKLIWNNNGRNFNFDTSTKAQSYTLGYASRDIQTGTSASNSYSTFYLQYPPKTISTPTTNQTSFQLININNNFPLVDTDVNGNLKTDCTPWNLVLEFTPITSKDN